MASLAPILQPSICAVKKRLMDLYIEAIRTITQLQGAQADSIIGGQLGLERVSIILEAAREKRDQAKLAYMLHIEKHGC